MQDGRKLVWHLVSAILEILGIARMILGSKPYFTLARLGLELSENELTFCPTLTAKPTYSSVALTLLFLQFKL